MYDRRKNTKLMLKSS